MSDLVYIPSAAAEPLSRSLWKLARPATIRQDDDTEFMFGWIVDLQQRRWLEVVTDFAITVHPDAELDGIADILQPWIDDGHLPSTTNSDLAALIESHKGQALVVYDAFPAVFKAMAKTRQELVDDGFLAPAQ